MKVLSGRRWRRCEKNAHVLRASSKRTESVMIGSRCARCGREKREGEREKISYREALAQLCLVQKDNLELRFCWNNDVFSWGGQCTDEEFRDNKKIVQPAVMWRETAGPNDRGRLVDFSDLFRSFVGTLANETNSLFFLFFFLNSSYLSTVTLNFFILISFSLQFPGQLKITSNQIKLWLVTFTKHSLQSQLTTDSLADFFSRQYDRLSFSPRVSFSLLTMECSVNLISFHCTGVTLKVSQRILFDSDIDISLFSVSWWNNRQNIGYIMFDCPRALNW